ncbi:hypothetical protein JW766_00825 [Candidatus Dojkabacteria bacterium]|nr:hypothetical protein [Candidatus Dojkabacteria bacterium]
MKDSSFKNNVALFDSCWLVKKGVSTYELLLSIFNSSKEELFKGRYYDLIKKLAAEYRDIESQRWAKGGKERYHTHGLFSEWVACKMILKYRTQIIDRLKKESSECYSYFYKRVGEVESQRLLLFMIMVASMYHDVGGIRDGHNVGANPDAQILHATLDKVNSLESVCRDEILKLANFTGYDNKRNAAYFSYEGGFKFEPEKISIGGIIVIVSDLLQIGALDYRERVEKDLGLTPYMVPYTYVKLCAFSMIELAQMLKERHPSNLIPEEIRDRAVKILVSEKAYEWRDQFITKNYSS